MYITFKGYKCLLKDYDNIKYTNGGIPKIIIKTSWHKRNNIPDILNKILKNTIFINPEYKLYYFDDYEIEEFMKSYSIRAYNAYKKIIPKK
jgi:mannosyltransferase OCH1-like enzyme